MGMDVYGIAHEGKIEALRAKHNGQYTDAYFKERAEIERNPGVYFRASVWSWHPIWEYVCRVAGDLIDEETRNACHYNDGRGLDEETSKKVAARLYVELHTGGTERFIEDAEESLKALPDEPCRLCEGTGVRTDAIGVQMGQPEKDNPHTGGKGWCNGCGGKGTIRPWATHYGFDRDHLREFAEFLEHCGGFKVW